MTALILGIDPDSHGALALVHRETGVLVDVIDMPIMDIKGGRLIDVRQLASIVDEHATSIGEAFVEKAWGRPMDPPSFAFRVGHNYGAVLGVVAAHFIRLHVISPQGWKKAMGVTSDKETSRQEASLRYPADCRRWARIKDHGRAEAVLIAAFGRRQILRENAAEAA